MGRAVTVMDERWRLVVKYIGRVQLMIGLVGTNYFIPFGIGKGMAGARL